LGELISHQLTHHGIRKVRQMYSRRQKAEGLRQEAGGRGNQSKGFSNRYRRNRQGGGYKFSENKLDMN